METSLRRRLDAELVRRGIARGRDDAKRLIGAGGITVDGSSLVKPSSLVSESAAIGQVSDSPRWASRGGFKLAHALTEFGLDPSRRRALDVGASTGGFTDVLLVAGAATVTAVDVGYGQMVWRLSQDPRVTVVDRTNFRTVDPILLGDPFTFVVADVSFISVGLVAPKLAVVGTDGADYVVLVKPQFEVGRKSVGRGGIVKDQTAQAWAIDSVADALARHGVGVLRVTQSPITGSKGNREFLIHGRRGEARVLSKTEISSAVAR